MRKKLHPHPSFWSSVFLLTGLSVYVYAFMEWVFFVTKPSFMSGMPVVSQIRIYFLSALGLSVVPLLAVVLLSLAARLIGERFGSRIFAAAGILIPSLILSALFLLLIDNFTYTVFKVGVVSTERIPRALYGFLFLLLVIFVYWRINRTIAIHAAKKIPAQRVLRWVLTGLLLFSGVMSVPFLFRSSSNELISAGPLQTNNLPNIILLGSDGMNANHMSAYGYERDTTPNLQAKLADALVVENAFPNGGTTAGSVASILTGKLPIETRVIYPPDILRGEDSYQHLPGILKRLGYQTVDVSIPYFGDALTLNMQGGFDLANQRSGQQETIVKLSRMVGGGDSAYFVDTLLQRVLDRVLHIFFIKPMTNPYERVIEPASREDEQKRFSDLVTALESSEGPVFVHVHMLGTHGSRFEIGDPVFSAGQVQNMDWMVDFYDDSVLNFDRYAGELFDYLSDTGDLDDTLIIVYSDHGKMWTVHERVPLLFWFPEGKHAGTIADNVENLDIAPTILDYLGVPVPEWMAGQSLLQDRVTASPYIFSSSVDTDMVEVSKNGLWVVDAGRNVPPFYQIGYVGLVACDQWFELYVKDPGMRYGKVKGHDGLCETAGVLSPEDAKRLLLEHLSRNGFDTSSYPDSIPVQNVQ